MPLQHLLVIYLISTLLVFLPSFGLAKLFVKAKVPAWKAYVPFYNTWVMQEIAQRPKHWVFWQFIPVIGWFITPGIFIEFAKVFAKYSFGAHTMASLLPFIYFPYIASKPDTRFVGPQTVKLYQKPAWREWVDAAVFAVVAATLIRTFIFEAYTIPSGSMEKTLLVKDFLFVSKLSYGPRIPNTPLSVPFVHNYMPITNGKSYSELVQLPYIRWFGSMPKRNDVVVFNFPAGDTVIHKEGFESLTPYIDIKRMAEGNNGRDAKMILADRENYPVVSHPVDKTDNYIKRCVAVAGDSIEVKHNVVYLNGVRQEPPPYSELNYKVEVTASALDMDVMKSEYDVDFDKQEIISMGGNVYRMLLTIAAKDKMQKNGLIKTIEPWDTQERDVFPYDTAHNWTMDNFGPVWVPKKGATIQITPENFHIYERAIRIYEHTKLEERAGKYYINGQENSSYTFQMDYFWMMGDNRQGSQDSRKWGFVPEDRIVGKAWMIWFSWDGGPRWKRLFNIIK